MILAALFAVVIADTPASLVRLTPTTEECSTIVQQGMKPITEKRPDVHVLRPGAGALARPAVEGELVGLACRRDSIVPVLGDLKVLADLGVPFYIAQDERMLVLEQNDGRVRVRLLNGALRDGELAAIRASLDKLQLAANAASPSAR